MGKVIFGTALLILLIDAGLALITGYIAYSRKRSFRRWFLFGMVLPFVSIFIALAVGIIDEMRATRARGGMPAPTPEPGEF